MTDDFEAFRKRKQEQKQREADSAKSDEAEKRLGWVDGLGPAGPSNPKVKGFVLGRYFPKRVDPRSIKRPSGFESTSLTPDQPPGTERPPTVDPAEAEKDDAPPPKLRGFRKF